MNAVVKVTELEAQFVQALQEGTHAFVKAGKLLVELLDADSTAAERLISRNIPRSLLRTLENIGRGILLPEFAADRALARLPISDQRRIANGDVELLIIEKGEAHTLKIPDLASAEPKIRQQVLQGTRLRTLAEQRAYLESQRKEKEAHDVDYHKTPWTVVGKVVRIRAAVELTMKDLLDMQRALAG